LRPDTCCIPEDPDTRGHHRWQAVSRVHSPERPHAGLQQRQQ
jgi:hypothetical protein